MVDAESRSNSECNLSSSHSPFSDSQIDKISRRHCFAASTVTPVDAAGICVLLVPIGPVRKEKMLHWSNAIAQFSRLPISDIMPHVEASLATKFSGGPHSEDSGGMDAEGELRFLFSVDTNEDHEYLEGLQTYRQTLGVIGIMDCNLCDDVSGCYEEFLHTLSRHTTAVAYRCWAFDPLPDQPDDVPGVTVIPNAGGTLLFYLQTLLCDFAGTMVSAIDLMAKSIEDKSGLQTPTEQAAQSHFDRSSSSLDKDAVSPSTSSSSDMNNNSRRSTQEASAAAAQTMTRRISQASFERRESTQSLPTSDSAAPAGVNIAPSVSSQESTRRGRFGGEIDRDLANPNMDRPDAARPNLSPSIATVSSSVREKKQAAASNTIGESANVGRLKKLQGDLYLMSGRLSEACNAFSASIDVSRTFTDYLWQAVAMEGYCAALLQMCARQNERRLVSAYLSTVPKTSVSEPVFSLASIRASMIRPPQAATTLKGTAISTAGTPATGKDEVGAGGSNNSNMQGEEFSLDKVLGSIGGLVGQIPLLYEKCFTFTPLLHAEACIREALVLFATREACLHDPERALHSLLEINRLHPRSANKLSQATRDVVANTQNIPLRSVINDWLQRGWTSSYSSLEMSDQLEMSSEISGLFRGLGYSRKSFFFLRQFLLMAVPILLRTSATGKFRSGVNSSSSSSTPARPSESSAHEYSAMSMLPDGASAFAAVSAAAAAAATTTTAAAGASGIHWQPSNIQQALLNISGTARSHIEAVGTSSSSDADVSGAAVSAMNASMKEWATRSKPTLKNAVLACIDALIQSMGAGDAKRTLNSSAIESQNGWLSIQADAIRECLSIAEALPSYPHAIASGFRLVSCLNELAATVSGSQHRALLEEQHMVRNYLTRTIAIYHQQYHFDPASLNLEPSMHSSTVLGRDGKDDCPRVVGRDAAVVGGALDSLLVGIQFCTFPGSSAPILAVSKASEPQTNVPSLFLHNPSAQLQGDTPPLLAAYEDVYFVATLSNPFPFGLQLNELELIATIVQPGDASKETMDQSFLDTHASSNANDVNTERAQCFIPAGAQGQVLLKITPKLSGQLMVKGMCLSLFQHLSVQCILAQEQEGDAKQRIRERPLKQRLEIERNSLLGLDKPLPGSPSARLSTMNAGYLLSTTVVPPLPRLSVIESSLAREESLSLYEGESRVIKLVVANGSGVVAAEQISVAFEPLYDERKSADDPKADLRMCDLVDSAFSYLHESDVFDIGPQSSYCLQVRVAGLAGLKGCEVVVRYGNSTVPEWSRELRWPVSVSVARLIVPLTDGGNGAGIKFTDLPPYISRSLCSGSDSSDGPSGELVEILRDVYSAAEGDRTSDKRKESALDSFYLAEINLQNMGPTEVQLVMETDLSENRNRDADSLHMGTVSGANNGLVKTLVASVPGQRSLTRVVLPLRHTCLSTETASSPMPGIEADGGPDKGIFYSWRTSLLAGEETQREQEEWRRGDSSRRKGRQFVVSQTANMSKGELATRREVYWCQLDIASRVRMRWRCRQSGRSGYVDPRLFFALSEHDLRIVRPRSLHVQVSVTGVVAERVDRGVLQAKCNVGEQSTIKLELTNRHTSSIDARISVCAVTSSAAASMDEHQQQKSYGNPREEIKALEYASDAYHRANASCSVNALATANVCLDFASSLPDSRADFSKGRFAFRPSGNGLGTDGNLSTKDAGLHPDPISLMVPPLLTPHGLSFDDIQDMGLPEIMPGETQTLTFPVYILHPGRYQLEYKVSAKRHLPKGMPGYIIEDLAQEILVIDGAGK